jgi:hypothetical protein
MGLRRTIKLDLIGRINSRIRNSEAIKQNSILSLFFTIFVGSEASVFLFEKETKFASIEIFL